MIKHIGALFLFFFLIGCSSQKSVESNYVLESSRGTGLIVTSISFRGHYSTYSIYYSSLDGQNNGRIQFGAGKAGTPSRAVGDLEEFNRMGEVFAIEVPAGDYHIYHWSVASGYAFVKPESNLSINFKVVPGKATYIGNFDFIETNNFGLTVTGVKVNYIEQVDIDLKILSKKYQHILPTDVLVGVGKGASYEGIGGNHTTNWDIPIILVN